MHKRFIAGDHFDEWRHSGLREFLKLLVCKRRQALSLALSNVLEVDSFKKMNETEIKFVILSVADKETNKSDPDCPNIRPLIRDLATKKFPKDAFRTCWGFVSVVPFWIPHCIKSTPRSECKEAAVLGRPEIHNELHMHFSWQLLQECVHLKTGQRNIIPSTLQTKEEYREWTIAIWLRKR